MTSIRFAYPKAAALPLEFHKGDKVVLLQGTYQGTPGIFLGLREDVKWADISECHGDIRSHPVAWLALAGDASRRRVN